MLMIMKPLAGRLITLLSLALAAGGAQAEQFKTFGAYDVHYIIINTTDLDPTVAQQYRINRSGTNSLINISILEKNAQGMPKGIAASITGTATNLVGQLRELGFREVREGPAVYYLATLQVPREELYRFDIRIQPSGAAEPFTLSFRQTVYPERD